MQRCTLLLSGWLALWPTLVTAARAADAASAPASAPARLPVPSGAALSATQGLLRDLFGDLARKTAADKAKVLEQMMTLARDPKTPADERYVVLLAARDLAIELANVDAALAAVDDLDAQYAVNGFTLREEALSKLQLKVRGGDPAVALTDAYLSLAEQLETMESFDEALKTLATAQKVARLTQDADKLQQVTQALARVTRVKQEYDRVAPALQRLLAEPDNPQANLAVGRFMCFVRGSWDKGLAMLAKGADAGLKAVAQLDLAGADTPSRMADIADAWFALAEKAPKADASAAAMRQRAGEWYRKAAAGADGLLASKIKARLQALADAAAGSGGPAAGQVFDLLKLIDPARHTIRGTLERRAGGIICPVDNAGSFAVAPVLILGNYEIEGTTTPLGQAFLLLPCSRGTALLEVNPNTSVVLRGAGATGTSAHWPAPASAPATPGGPVAPAGTIRIKARVTETLGQVEIAVSIEDQPALTWKGRTQDVAFPAGKLIPPNDRLAGIGAHVAGGGWSACSLRLLSGTARPFDGPLAKPDVPPTPATPAAPKPPKSPKR